jgi:D-alanine-D-alanine ligase
MRKLRVTVLTGGVSPEREICLMSGRKVLDALDPARYEVKSLDLAAVSGRHAVCLMDGGTAWGELEAQQGQREEDDKAAGLARLLAPTSAVSPAGDARPAVGQDSMVANSGPDVVFIALHGGAGENGSVQGMLEVLGIPYTGSGVLASALAMNKIIAKKVFERERIPTPEWIAVHAGDPSVHGKVAARIGLPCVTKPACQGSTIGVSIVRTADELGPALDTAFSYGPDALVERFIAGTEISGPVIGNDDAQVLPLIEIVPSGGFYDYERKYTPGATEEIVPARLPEAIAARARELTLRAHHALGCRGISRVDMMATPEEVFVLEVNTIPGLTETSLVPRAAQAAGISFPQLVDRLIELALEERGGGGDGRGS